MDLLSRLETTSARWSSPWRWTDIAAVNKPNYSYKNQTKVSLVTRFYSVPQHHNMGSLANVALQKGDKPWGMWGREALIFWRDGREKKKTCSQLFSEPSSWSCRVADLTAHLVFNVCVPSVEFIPPEWINAAVAFHHVVGNTLPKSWEYLYQ